MAKHPTVTDKKFVKETIDKWRKRMFLAEWFIDVSYSDESNPGCSAENSVNIDYLRSTITIHPNFWDAPRDWQEHALVHELAHIISEPMYKLHIDSLNFKVVTPDHIETLREQLTQRIANMVFQQEWD